MIKNNEDFINVSECNYCNEAFENLADKRFHVYDLHQESVTISVSGGKCKLLEYILCLSNLDKLIVIGGPKP